jgi:hypothetical protein
MKPRSKVVWKLSAVVAAVLALAIALAAYSQYRIHSHYWLATTHPTTTTTTREGNDIRL